MAQFSLGKPITIDGEEVVVVRDVIDTHQVGKDAETYSIVEQRGDDGRPAIYVAENDLARLRDDYPGIKVYGLWQILFYNNAVRLGAQLVTFPLTETGGLYLVLDGAGDFNDPASITQSGEYVDRYIPDLHDVIDLNNANVLDVDLTSLKLPPQPAYTRLELSDKLKAANKRRWLVVGSFCAVIMVIAAAGNYGLQTIYKSRMADYTTKHVLIDDLSGRVRALSAERLIKRPDDAVALKQLFRLFELYPKANTPTSTDELKVGFKGSHVLITPAHSPVDPAKVIRGATTELQRDLSYKVTLVPVMDGQGIDVANGVSQ